MDYIVKHSATSVIIRTKLYDSSSVEGAGLTGLAYNSSGLIISTIASNEASATAYTVAGSTIETITTLGTYAAPTATKCRFKEIDATNHPGEYEIHLADARFAVASANELVISIGGALNLVQKRIRVQLDANTAEDVYTRIGSTGSGLTTLATAAALDAVDNFIDTEIADIQSRLPAALVGGKMDSNVGAISTDTTAADNLEAMLDGTGGVNINLQQLIITAGDALPNIVLAGSGSADGIAFTRSGSGDPFDSNFAAQIQQEASDALTAYDPPTNTEMVAAFTEIKGATWSALSDTPEHIRDKQTDIETDTQDLQTQVGTDGAGLTAIPWNAAWDAEVESECTDALNAYDPPTNAELMAAVAPLATATALDAVDNYVDTEIAAIQSALTTIEGKIDTVDSVVDANAVLLADIPTVSEFETRTPTAAQLAYIVANSALGMPVTFSGSGSATSGIIATVDGNAPSSVDNVYNGRILIFDNKEVVRITAYNGTTKAATVTASVASVSSSRTARMM